MQLNDREAKILARTLFELGLARDQVNNDPVLREKIHSPGATYERTTLSRS